MGLSFQKPYCPVGALLLATQAGCSQSARRLGIGTGRPFEHGIHDVSRKA